MEALSDETRVPAEVQMNSFQGSLESNTCSNVANTVSTAQCSSGMDDEEEQMDSKPGSLSLWYTSFNANILPRKLRWVFNNRVPHLLEATLRGISQVVIVNNPVSGVIILFALLIDSVWMFFVAFATTIFATWIASHFFVDKAYVKNGLSGYNATLVACAFVVFLQNEPWHFGTMVACLFGGLCSAILNLSLRAMMGSVPTWTLAFNIVTLPGLAYSLPALAGQIIPVETIVQKELYLAGLINSTDPLVTAVDIAHEETVADTNHVLLSPFVGVSQIFVVNNPWSGALILIAMALESRGLAFAAFMGSCVGCVCGAFVGGEIGITDGLWGFNSSLVAVAVAVFFVPSWGACGVALVASIAAGILFAGMGTAMGSAFTTPCLTLPFCIIATICHLLLSDGDIRGCIGARDPICPELNYAAWQEELKEREKNKKIAEAANDQSGVTLEHATDAMLKKEANEQARVFYGPSTVQPHDTLKSAVDRTLRSTPTEGKKHQLLTGTDPNMHQEVAQRPRRPAGRVMDESNALETSTTPV